MSKTPAPIPHPVATANRVALANRIVETLDSNPGLFASGAPSALAVAQFGPSLWEVVNNSLGRERPISPLTVAVVIGILAAREVRS